MTHVWLADEGSWWEPHPVAVFSTAELAKAWFDAQYPGAKEWTFTDEPLHTEPYWVGKSQYSEVFIRRLPLDPLPKHDDAR